MGWLSNTVNKVSSAFNPSKWGSEDDPVFGGPLGDFVPGIGDARAQEEANKQNIILQRQNRDWMERMSNTAYQRAMTDMKQAGLNPMLAYQQGGASVPSPSAPEVQSASKSGLANAALGAFTGISSAQTARQNAGTAQAQAQSTISLQGAQAANTIAQTAKTEAETKKTIDSIHNQKVRRELEKAQIPLQKVKESAAAMAQKGVSTIERIGDNLLKSTAKPSMNPRTLEYENPYLKGFKNFFGSDDGPMIKNKRK